MDGNFFLAQENSFERDHLIDYVTKNVDRIIGDGGDACIKVERYEKKRTLPANALYWQWMSFMAAHYSGKGVALSKDDMHDLMRHKFLGWTNARKVGNTHIGATLKSTSKLSNGEMCRYMEQVSAWASNFGVMLPTPEDSEYMRMIERQIA